MSQDDTPDLATPQAGKVAPEAVALRPDDLEQPVEQWAEARYGGDWHLTYEGGGYQVVTGGG